MNHQATPTVALYDTTLRDGTQGEGMSLTVRDKLRIAQRLDAFGVAYIEGGWPGSNPKDAEFFRRARDLGFAHARLAAFGSTRRIKNAAKDDANLQALVDAGTPVCTIFGKTWTLHVTEVLRITKDENLQIIEDTCAFLRAAGREVFYDAEHFFDGYAADAAYALSTLDAAIRGGASAVILCDTNGGGVPWQIEEATRVVVGRSSVTVGIHTHDDTGCAVANALAAVRAGARQVQGTINGYGERCGNANLSVLAPNLELKLGLPCLPAGHLAQLGDVSHFVAEVANVTMNESMAYVGRSAFAHKGGVHVAAMRRTADSYQHVRPELVGNVSRVLVSELSGRGNVLAKAEELGESVAPEDAAAALEVIKEAEARGLSYEGAEASVALLLRRRRPDYQPLFEVLDYHVDVGRRRGTHVYSEATVRVGMGDVEAHMVADGNGPVSALDAALRKALSPVYPEIASVHLTDYKVRILDGSHGTGSVTRVLIDHRNEHESWSTVGGSSNIIDASLHALADGMEYGLRRLGVTPRSEAAPSAPPSSVAPRTSIEA